jgi:hypothetical protein
VFVGRFGGRVYFEPDSAAWFSAWMSSWPDANLSTFRCAGWPFGGLEHSVDSLASSRTRSVYRAAV